MAETSILSFCARQKSVIVSCALGVESFAEVKMKRSAPELPVRISAPLPPVMRSLPEPPSILSLPEPP